MADDPPSSDGDDAGEESAVHVGWEGVPDMLSSDQVYQRIVADADHEITSGTRELFFAAVAGGFAITITYLLYASMTAATDGAITAVLLYPLGFIYRSGSDSIRNSEPRYSRLSRRSS